MEISHRRRLPHIEALDQPVFVTWRLHGSLPVERGFQVPSSVMRSGEAFFAMDRVLDHGRVGPHYLRMPEIAGMVVESLRYGAERLGLFELHAFCVMSNHVHVLLTPHVTLSTSLRRVKGFTGRQGNLSLGVSGKPFWQAESYDRVVRSAAEFERIRRYVEENPVVAGVVRVRGEYRWSSAWSGGDGGGVRGVRGEAKPGMIDGLDGLGYEMNPRGAGPDAGMGIQTNRSGAGPEARRRPEACPTGGTGGTGATGTHADSPSDTEPAAARALSPW